MGTLQRRARLLVYMIKVLFQWNLDIMSENLHFVFAVDLNITLQTYKILYRVFLTLF